MSSPRNILLVDDEEALRLSFKRELQSAYTVTTASCVEDAAELLSKETYDLLLTDLVMPGSDGLELLRQAKSNHPEMPVIIITGYGQIEAVIKAMRLGADDFLLKPCDIEDLLQCIERVFGKVIYFNSFKNCERILSASPVLVALVDRNGVFLELNRSWQKACGRSREELMGTAMAEIFGQQIFDMKISPALARCFAGEALDRHELFRFAGREECSMAVAYRPQRDEGRETVTAAAISMTDITALMQDRLGLQRSEQRMRLIWNVSSDGFMDCDLDRDLIFYSANWQQLLGRGLLEASGTAAGWLEQVHPHEQSLARLSFDRCVDGSSDGYDIELRLRHADQGWRWFRTCARVVEHDGVGTPLRLIATLSDIDEMKKLQSDSLQFLERLEQKIGDQKLQLAGQNKELEEANSALTVLLKKRQQDRAELEKELHDNVINIVAPLIKRLQRTTLDEDQSQLVDSIENSLREITSSFVTRLAGQHVGLTPMEIQVANHVKQGKVTKEIADILCLAPETINVHRKNIRKKLGLRHKSVNLRTFLISLAED